MTPNLLDLNKSTIHSHIIVPYLLDLRESILAAFEAYETTHKFKRKKWQHHEKGGGEMAVLRGDVFEKAAVNFSEVRGQTFPGDDGSGPFYATGVSLITHMSNPKMPTVHFNIRYIATEETSWFAGGYDLTPMGFPFEEDTQHFHHIAKEAIGKDLYKDFSNRAKDYFYIKHWNRERGVGGIFFDHYNTGDIEQDLSLWKAVGESFLPAILPIYDRRRSLSFTEEDKEIQLHYRAQYAEFNFLYDRGTKFGFNSGGNPEAILCSMPPVAKW